MQHYWIMESAWGQNCASTFSNTRGNCISQFIKNIVGGERSDWRKWRRKGWKCKKVYITEVKCDPWRMAAEHAFITSGLEVPKHVTFDDAKNHLTSLVVKRVEESMKAQLNTHPFYQLQFDVFQNAKKKGWYDNGKVPVDRRIALLHSEISEITEAERDGNPPSEKIPAFSRREEELADTLLRILDWAEADNLDVWGAALAKHEYNKTREHKHGGKEF